MVKTVTLGSRSEANELRDNPRVAPHLAPSDDRRQKTVRLQNSAPDSIIERLRTQAFESQRSDRKSAGQVNLTDSEKSSLKRTTSFNWQQHGFEAMQVKGELQRKGATEWMDFYEPGEGVAGSMKNLRSSKQRAGESGASIGVGGDYTDEEEMGRDRMRKQSERMRSGQTKAAKEPAILEQDTDAQDFLREEMAFEDDVLDISLSEGNGGMVEGAGRDFELLQDRNQQRSDQAVLMDDLKAAPKTRDPFKWSNNPAKFDYPGIDTVDPEKVQKRRSEAAIEADNSKLAQLATSPAEWAEDPGATDLPGIDTPASTGMGGLTTGDKEAKGALDELPSNEAPDMDDMGDPFDGNPPEEQVGKVDDGMPDFDKL